MNLNSYAKFSCSQVVLRVYSPNDGYNSSREKNLNIHDQQIPYDNFRILTGLLYVRRISKQQQLASSCHHCSCDALAMIPMV